MVPCVRLFFLLKVRGESLMGQREVMEEYGMISGSPETGT